MKAGIPKALLNIKYHPLWNTFFNELGIETVSSPDTNRTILENGNKYTIDETCLPVKVFSGHAYHLRDKADFIFIPRFRSVEKGNFVCCKFLGLPDVCKNCIPGLPEIVTLDIDYNRMSLAKSMFKFGEKFTKDRSLIRQALTKSHKAQSDAERKLYHIPQADLKIGLLSHSYNILDTYINMDIEAKIRSFGAEVITPEMIPPEVTLRESKKLSSEAYWTFSKEIIGAAAYLSEGIADGLISFVSFSCGPESMLSELIFRKLKDKIPVLNIVFDEETGEAGLLTRLESFIEMIRRRKQK
jgi:predicted nucleotide-binding protein (sugar kinase/HSP70/actin superfamily)